MDVSDISCKLYNASDYGAWDIIRVTTIYVCLGGVHLLLKRHHRGLLWCQTRD